MRYVPSMFVLVKLEPFPFANIFPVDSVLNILIEITKQAVYDLVRTIYNGSLV